MRKEERTGGKERRQENRKKIKKRRNLRENMEKMDSWIKENKQRNKK